MIKYVERKLHNKSAEVTQTGKKRICAGQRDAELLYQGQAHLHTANQRPSFGDSEVKLRKILLKFLLFYF